MFNKEAKNSILENGFQSKPQVRYLLHLMRLYPDRYSWVKDALKDHGMPEEEEPLHTYWEGPYKVSPDTPSYTYTGRRSANLKNLLKLAEKLDLRGKAKEAETLDLFVAKKAAIEMKPFIIDERAAKETANRYWSIRGNEITRSSTTTDLAKLFKRFEDFEPYKLLSASSQEEAQKYLSDLLKDKLRTIGYQATKIAKKD